MTDAPTTDARTADAPTAEAPEQPSPEAAAPEIDPRIQERRSRVEAAAARRRAWVLGLLGSVVALGGLAWGVTRSPLLAVHRVDVSGADHTSVAAIVAAGGLGEGTPETDIDPHGARVRIEALPWIASARVRRVWPRRVTVVVRERVPVATATAASGGWALLDGSGRVLALLDQPSDDLPLLDGVPPAGPPASRVAKASRPALAIAAALPPDVRAKVVLVVVSPDGAELRLRPEGTVKLGSLDRLDEKLRTTETLLARADLRRLAVLDVRVPANPVLTRQP